MLRYRDIAIRNATIYRLARGATIWTLNSCNVLSNLFDSWAAGSSSGRLCLLLNSSFNDCFPLLLKLTVKLFLLITSIQRLEVHCSSNKCYNDTKIQWMFTFTLVTKLTYSTSSLTPLPVPKYCKYHICLQLHKLRYKDSNIWHNTPVLKSCFFWLHVYILAQFWSWVDATWSS